MHCILSIPSHTIAHSSFVVGMSAVSLVCLFVGHESHSVGSAVLHAVIFPNVMYVGIEFSSATNPSQTLMVGWGLGEHHGIRTRMEYFAYRWQFRNVIELQFG